MTTALILAGGLGTRLRDTVPDLPKPMAPIRGRPFLAHQMDYWLGQGVKEFIISIGYKGELIRRHFGDKYHGAAIRYAPEDTPLGTGGGLLLAAQQIDKQEPFLVMNGDTFFEVELAALAGFHARNNSAWTFSLLHATEYGRYMGMDIAADGRVLSLKAAGGYVNGGVYMVNPATLRHLAFTPGSKASLEDDLLAAIMAGGGALFGVECAGRFIDIGIPEDYFRAAELLPH